MGSCWFRLCQEQPRPPGSPPSFMDRRCFKTRRRRAVSRRLRNIDNHTLRRYVGNNLGSRRTYSGNSSDTSSLGHDVQETTFTIEPRKTFDDDDRDEVIYEVPPYALRRELRRGRVASKSAAYRSDDEDGNEIIYEVPPYALRQASRKGAGFASTVIMIESGQPHSSDDEDRDEVIYEVPPYALRQMIEEGGPSTSAAAFIEMAYRRSRPRERPQPEGSASPLPSPLPSRTPSPSPSQTASLSVSIMASASASASVLESASASVLESESASRSASISESASQSASVLESATPSASRSASVSESQSQSTYGCPSQSPPPPPPVRVSTHTRTQAEGSSSSIAMFHYVSHVRFRSACTQTSWESTRWLAEGASTSAAGATYDQSPENSRSLPEGSSFTENPLNSIINSTSFSPRNYSIDETSIQLRSYTYGRSHNTLPRSNLFRTPRRLYPGERRYSDGDQIVIRRALEQINYDLEFDYSRDSDTTLNSPSERHGYEDDGRHTNHDRVIVRELTRSITMDENIRHPYPVPPRLRMRQDVPPEYI